MWLRIRCTGAASVIKATMSAVSAIGWIAAALAHGASVRSGSDTALPFSLAREWRLPGRRTWPRPTAEGQPSRVSLTTATRRPVPWAFGPTWGRPMNPCLVPGSPAGRFPAFLHASLC
jgi:hypothetical protein